jgi:hypothetical protein
MNNLEINFDSVNAIYKKINTIFDSNDNIETKKINYNNLLLYIDSLFEKEKLRLIKKYNNEIKYFKLNAKTKIESLEALNLELSKRKVNIIYEYDKIKFPSDLTELNIKLKNIFNNKNDFLNDLENIKSKINKNINIKLIKNKEIEDLLLNLENIEKKEINDLQLQESITKSYNKKHNENILKVVKYLNNNKRSIENENINLQKDVFKIEKNYNKEKKNIGKKIEKNTKDIFTINNKILIINRNENLLLNDKQKKELSILNLELQNLNLEHNSYLEESIFIDQNYIISTDTLKNKIELNKKTINELEIEKNSEIDFLNNNYYLDVFKNKIKLVNNIIKKKQIRKLILEFKNIIKEKDIFCEELKKAKILIENSIIDLNRDIFDLKSKIEKKEELCLKNYKFFSNFGEYDLHKLNNDIHVLNNSIIDLEKITKLNNEMLIFLEKSSLKENQKNKIMLGINKFIKKGFNTDDFNLIILIINYHKMTHDNINYLH